MDSRQRTIKGWQRLMATSTSQPDVALEAIRQASAAMLAATETEGVEQRRALAEEAIEELTVFFGALVGAPPEQAWEETARWAEHVQTALLVEGWKSVRKREKRPHQTIGALALAAVLALFGACGLRSIIRHDPINDDNDVPTVLVASPSLGPKVPPPAWALTAPDGTVDLGQVLDA